MVQIKIKKLNPNANTPTRGSEQAAGYDIYACLETETATIPAHCTVKVPTGISMAIPEGYFGGIFARSGLASKQGLRPANCVGVIDSDYRGEFMVMLHNDTDEPKTIKNGDRVGQLVILPCMPIEFEETDSLDETERGSGGFGSSGR